MDVWYGGADDLFLHPRAISGSLTTGAFTWMVAIHVWRTGWMNINFILCELFSHEHPSNKRRSYPTRSETS